MTLHSRWINNALVYYDQQSTAIGRNRIIDAVGPDVLKFIDHFDKVSFPAANNMAGYVTTLVGASTVADAGLSGGAVTLTTAGAENDGVALQPASAAFMPALGHPVYFGCRLQLSEATQSEFFAGFAPIDTTIIASEPDNVICFEKHDGDTNVDVKTRDTTTDTATAAVDTLVAATYNVYEFWYDGVDSVQFYIDGALVATHTTNIALDTPYAPSIELKTGEGVAHTMTVDWLRAFRF